MKKRFLLFVFILLLGACGCKMGGLEISKYTSKEIETDNDIIAEMINFEKNKYKDYSFQKIAFIRQGFEYGYDLLTLKTQIEEEEVVYHVKRWINTNGDHNIEDNLFGSIVKKQYDSMLTSELSCFFDDFFVVSHLDSIDYPNSLTSKSGLNELISERPRLTESVIVSIYIKESSEINDKFEVLTQTCVNKLKDKDVPALYNFLCIKNEYYDKITENAYEDQDNLLSREDAVVKQSKIRSR